MKLFAVALSFNAFAFHQRLHAIERISRDERLMGATVDLAEPSEVPDVDGVLQEPMQLGFRHLAVAARMAEPDFIRLDRQGLERVFPGRIQVEHGNQPIANALGPSHSQAPTMNRHACHRRTP
jgi:hypothetical protein